MISRQTVGSESTSDANEFCIKPKILASGALPSPRTGLGADHELQTERQRIQES